MFGLELRMPRLFVRGASELPEKDVEQLFEKYGHVINIQTGQAGFSFIVSGKKKLHMSTITRKWNQIKIAIQQ